MFSVRLEGKPSDVDCLLRFNFKNKYADYRCK